MQTPQTQASLNRARLLLEEGRSEAARAVIDTIHAYTDAQQRDVSYLLGWYYVANSQWNDAVQTLSPLLSHTLLEDAPDTLLERERLAIYLLRLGQTAVNLAHYEDASQHFLRCLKLLHDRRVHLPAIRIEARYSLAMTYVMRGSYTLAIQHYEDALRLCRHYELNESLPHIYYGMSEAYRCMGDFTKAHDAAREALHIYQERGDEPLQSRIYTLLGRISLLLGDYDAALDYYTKSYTLAVSNNKLKMVMLSCTALAEVYAEQGNMREAHEYAQRALKDTTQIDDAYLCGVVYATIGRITLVEAHSAQDTNRQRLVDEGISWLQKSVTQLHSTQASKDLAQIYTSLATVFEEVNRSQEALAYWKLAYAERDKAKNIPCASI
jgi:tetratricopeptide (TPR) repeat protein